jgi:hypothetical protein
VSFYLKDKIDFEQHNAEVKQLMSDYCNNGHKRVLMIIGGSICSYFCNPYLNNSGFSFKDFFAPPKAQLKCQLEYQYYRSSGYTTYSPEIKSPGLKLVKKLATSVLVPIIAEGRYNTSEYVKLEKIKK